MSNERNPVSFPNWKEALAAMALSEPVRASYRREIVAFLHHCNAAHAPATVMLAKQYLEVGESQGRSEARPALRWFFKAAKTASARQAPYRFEAASAPSGRRGRGGSRAIPPPASSDPGAEGWELDLMKAVRSEGL